MRGSWAGSEMALCHLSVLHLIPKSHLWAWVLNYPCLINDVDVASSPLSALLLWKDHQPLISITSPGTLHQEDKTHSTPFPKPCFYSQTLLLVSWISILLYPSCEYWPWRPPSSRVSPKWLNISLWHMGLWICLWPFRVPAKMKTKKGLFKILLQINNADIIPSTSI